MKTLDLNRTQYLEFEKLALGAFAPLHGFMGEAEFHSVVNRMRLPAGDVFPLPVVLDLGRDFAALLETGVCLELTFEGQAVGEMTVTDLFECDKFAVAREVFGTDETAHPGVEHFYRMGAVFAGGPVTLHRRAQHDLSEFEMTPAETRELFAARGWTTVAGFQTRNVPHRAHEYLQRVALEHVDGLFIQPLVGRRKQGDYSPQAILRGYRALIDGFYPADRVVLGILTTAMRYAGPREAVFHAIVRRNYGCTHFIVGRDHAGVGNYYGRYEAHEMVRRFVGELGIEIMCLAGPFHCSACGGIATERTCGHKATDPSRIYEIAGTDIRAVLMGGAEPDARIMRPEVVESLSGVPLFVEANEP